MYEAQSGTNLGGAVAESGPDFSETLFSPNYVFGAPVYNIENNPPATTDVPPSGDVPDDWITLPPAQETPPVKGGGPSNGRWYRWDGTKNLVVQLHNNQNILAIWFPQEPPQIISVNAGLGVGAAIYTTEPYTSGEQVASEIIAIPSGHETLVLSAASAFGTTIFVLVSGEPYPPEKTFLTTIATVTGAVTVSGGPVSTTQQPSDTQITFNHTSTTATVPGSVGQHFYVTNSWVSGKAGADGDFGIEDTSLVLFLISLYAVNTTAVSGQSPRTSPLKLASGDNVQTFGTFSGTDWQAGFEGYVGA